MLNVLAFICSKLFAMARCAAAPIQVPPKHRHRLEAIERQHHAPQSLVTRARIAFMAGACAGVRETARALDLGLATVQRWRKRWRTCEGEPFAERLCDAPRPGIPPTSSSSTRPWPSPSAGPMKASPWPRERRNGFGIFTAMHYGQCCGGGLDHNAGALDRSQGWTLDALR